MNTEEFMDRADAVSAQVVCVKSLIRDDEKRNEFNRLQRMLKEFRDLKYPARMPDAKCAKCERIIRNADQFVTEFLGSNQHLQIS